MIKDVNGTAAIITGGASGIGFGMAQVFAEAGGKVFLADIEEPALTAAIEKLRAAGATVEGCVCDVSDRESVSNMVGTAILAFGRIQILCNNAGVGSGGPFRDLRTSDWDWVVGVNMMSVVYGIELVLPHMEGHGEPCHIVNTASIAGLRGVANMAPYCATKSAVVAISESFASEFEGSKIGMSVLCPGWVRTRITESARNRPDRFGPPRDRAATVSEERAKHVAAAIENGLDPREVGRQVLAAIRNNDLYIFTDDLMREPSAERFRAIQAAFPGSGAKLSSLKVEDV